MIHNLYFHTIFLISIIIPIDIIAIFPKSHDVLIFYIFWAYTVHMFLKYTFDVNSICH